MNYSELAERLRDGADDQGRGVVETAADVIHEMSEAYGYAVRLATAIRERHFPDVTQWRPLPELIGVLTQIDNMTSGLVVTTDEALNKRGNDGRSRH